jgi:hypothetical protein
MKVLGSFVIIFGVFSSINFFNAGDSLQRAGSRLTDLRSVGGETVAEAYYQEIGYFGLGYGSAAYAMGFGTLMVSLGLGGILISKSTRVDKLEKAQEFTG